VKAPSNGFERGGLDLKRKSSSILNCTRKYWGRNGSVVKDRGLRGVYERVAKERRKPLSYLEEKRERGVMERATVVCMTNTGMSSSEKEHR